MEVPVQHTGQINQAEAISTRKSNNLTAVLMFMVSPFVALLIAMKRYKAEWAKNIVWFFVVYYGYTFVISRPGMDANRYRDRLIEMANTELSFNYFISLFYSSDGGYLDFVQPMLTFLVSLFTDDYRILFAFFGLIFGYFYSRNIWYLIDRAGPYIRKEYIPFIITFAVLIGFWQINGFRMWTAAHIFFYGAIRYIMDSDKKGIFIAAGSMLVHFSFIIPIGLLIGYVILQNRIHLYYMFFVGTFFIAELDTGFIRDTLTSFLPEIFHGKVESYASESAFEQRMSGGRERSWHAMFYRTGLHWTVIIFLSIIYMNGRDFVMNNKPYLSLLGFTFLLYGLANLASFVPSGGRFISVALLFSVAAIFLYLQNAPKDRLIRPLLFFAIPALIFYCIVSIRIGFDTIGVLAILGNPIIALFGNIDIALIDFLK